MTVHNADGSQAVFDLLARLKAGDTEARQELLRVSQERLRRMASRMLDKFPRLRHQGRAETGLVLNDVLLGLHLALDEVEVDSPEHFFNLAARKIRLHLLDLARKYDQEIKRRRRIEDMPEPVAQTHASKDGLHEQDWAAFHEAVGRLPEAEREAFSLSYYGGWSRSEAAAILGVNEKTIDRRYLRAKVSLVEMLASG